MHGGSVFYTGSKSCFSSLGFENGILCFFRKVSHIIFFFFFAASSSANQSQTLSKQTIIIIASVSGVIVIFAFVCCFVLCLCR